MKIFKIFSLCLGFSLANASDLEWVELYQKGGASAIEQKIDSIIQTPSFWNEALKNKDTRFGYYENLQYLFIATKNAPTLRLYVLNDGHWNEKLNVESLVGSKGGPKRKRRGFSNTNWSLYFKCAFSQFRPILWTPCL